MRRTFGILYVATALCAIIGAALFSGCSSAEGIEEVSQKISETQCQTVPGLCASEGVPCFASDTPGPYDILLLHTSEHDPNALRCRRLSVISVHVQILPNMAAFGAASDNTISWVKMGVRTRLAMAQGINPGGSIQWNSNTNSCQINNPPSVWTRVMTEKVQGVWQFAQICQDGLFASFTDGVSSLVVWTP